MSLAAGTMLGSYLVESPLGAGGMGEVYRARDTKLGRSVAVKILPDAFTADADRVPRFEREAKVLASLNHPNIAALFGMEQSDERHFLVMELVEGETLAERLRRGPLMVEDALRIAIQITDALEAAHERGIVHRDLKPANVKITPDEKVKVLDFGLAKAMDTAPAAANLTNSPTLSMMATQGGVVLGTAAYMSPEQAKGAPADQRSDVFSFGVVLYEMLTARQPFHGDTAPEVMASVLVRDADLSALPPGFNPRLGDVIKRCLDKQPKKRWQAVGDLRAELEAIAAAPRATSAASSAARRPLWTLAVALGLGVAVGAVAGALITSRINRPDAPTVMRFPIRLDVPRLMGLTRTIVTVSPDGSQIVFVAGTSAGAQLFVRRIDQMDATAIAATATLAPINPVFSPDGQWVVFWSSEDPQGLRKVPVAGGAVEMLCRALAPYGVSWSDDSIVFAVPGVGIQRVSANGGEPETLVAIQTPQLAHGLQLLNSGRTLLYTLATDSVSGNAAERWDRAEIVLHSLDSGQRRTVVRGGSDARYLNTGHLVYAVGGTLLAVRFDQDTGQTSGSAVPIVAEVARSLNANTGAAQFDVSDRGTLVYLPSDPADLRHVLALATLDGTIRVLPMPAGSYSRPRVAPDGRRAAFTSDVRGESQIWVYDLIASTPPRRLTFGGQNIAPVWSPDGRMIAFQSSREGDLGIFQQRADGSGSSA